MSKQGNLTSPKKNNNSPVIDPTAKEILEMLRKESNNYSKETKQDSGKYQ